jgi:hypothetical protein
MLSQFGRFRLEMIVSDRRGAPRLGQAVEQLNDPTQAIEVEQVLGRRCGRTF